MKTYDRATFEAASKAWRQADLRGWDRIRRVAAERGMMYPPSGTKWDQWDDPEPSQVAVIDQLRDENEHALLDIIGRSSSWSQVISRISAARGQRRALNAIRREDEVYEASSLRIDHRESVYSLAKILRRISDSAGID